MAEAQKYYPAPIMRGDAWGSNGIAFSIDGVTVSGGNPPSAAAVGNIVTLSQASYDAIGSPAAATLYIIV